MSDTPETHAAVAAEMRNRSRLAGYILPIMLARYADRFEAAHKREVEATAAKCCQLGRLAGYGASEIKHQQESVGDAAKLREALSAALEQVNKVYDILSRPCVCLEEARQGCREARGVLIPALAEPTNARETATAEKSSVAVNAAKLREAIVHMIDTADSIAIREPTGVIGKLAFHIKHTGDAALAATEKEGGNDADK